MKTILVWYLVTVYYGLHYSPPMATLEECQRVKQSAREIYNGTISRCVQINEVAK